MVAGVALLRHCAKGLVVGLGIVPHFAHYNFGGPLRHTTFTLKASSTSDPPPTAGPCLHTRQSLNDLLNKYTEMKAYGLGRNVD